MARKPKTMYGPPLPPEIWREILATLPVKSILRCRSVCKSWYSLVSCPDFISHHSITNLRNNNGNRLLLCHKDWSYSSHDMDIESREHDYDYSPDPSIGRDFGIAGSSNGYIRIVGSCNGLICLSKNYRCNAVPTVTFLIWNPAIRKIVDLPSLHYSSRYSLVGFGFDSRTSDYKVMCNLRDFGSLDQNIQNVACEIFDLSKGVWRSISSLFPHQYTRDPEAECYVNGAVHWSVYRYDRDIRSILSFNMSDESFREIRLPDCAEFNPYEDDYHHMESRCVTFGGLLLVILWKRFDDGETELSASCSIWAMEEYGVTESWTKVSNIDLESARVSLNTRLYPKDFILWAEHEILMLHYHSLDDDEGYYYKQDLVSFNTESRKSKRLFCITKNLRNDLRLCLQLCLYKESLVLM